MKIKLQTLLKHNWRTLLLLLTLITTSQSVWAWDWVNQVNPGFNLQLQVDGVDQWAFGNGANQSGVSACNLGTVGEVKIRGAWTKLEMWNNSGSEQYPAIGSGNLMWAQNSSFTSSSNYNFGDLSGSWSGNKGTYYKDFQNNTRATYNTPGTYTLYFKCEISGQRNDKTKTWRNDAYIYNNGGSYYQVTFTIASPCTPPTVTPTGNSRCGAGSVTLSASTTAGTISWWASTTSESALGTGTSYAPSVSSTTTYYVSATDGGCTSERVAVTATVYARPSISSTTPGSRCGTGTVTLSATATDSESGTLKIKWYDASSSGTLLQNNTSNNYTTAEISATTNYWVTVTNATKHTDTNTSRDFYCSASSRTQITATVSPEPAITVQPASTVVACSGEIPSPSSLSVTATGTGLSYQWQLSTTSAEGPWSDLSDSKFKAASFNFGTAASGGRTFYYRCKVTSSSCSEDPIYSNVATLTIIGKPTAGSISGSTSVCSGTNFTLTLSGHTSSGTTIQWQKSTNGGSTWSNVTNGTPTGTTGATTASLTTSQTVATQYRAVVTTTTGGCSRETDGYSVAITPNASIGSVTLSSPSICMGQTGTQATANTVVTGGGVGAWSSTNTSVATVNSSGVITTVGAGTTNIKYTITDGCGGTKSAQATLTVNPNNSVAGVTISLDKNNVCAGVSVQASKSGTPVVSPGATAQWYSSTAKATIDPSTGAITTNSGGTSNISYRVTGGCGSTVETSAQTLTIKSIPTLTPASSSVENFTPVRIGANEDVTWSVAEQASDSYLFEQTARKTKFKGTVGAGANKTFTVNGTGANGCAGSATVTVTKDNESCN